MIARVGSAVELAGLGATSQNFLSCKLDRSKGREVEIGVLKVVDRVPLILHRFQHADLARHVGDQPVRAILADDRVLGILISVELFFDVRGIHEK